MRLCLTGSYKPHFKDSIYSLLHFSLFWFEGLIMGFIFQNLPFGGAALGLFQRPLKFLFYCSCSN